MRATVVIGLLASLNALTGRGEERPHTPPQKVLERLVGNWNSEGTERKGDEESRVTGTMKWEWILGGRILQGKGTRNPGKIENLQIIGFDPVKNEYRIWAFDTLGTMLGPIAGQWDEDLKTLTWQGRREDDLRLVNRVHFIDNDNLEWHTTMSDKDGAVLFKQQGKSVRQK